jgi:nicotinamide-nucleotide amidase
VPARPITTAEILSIGSELTVGETLDTNAGELARDLTAMGISVGRFSALPDELDAVTDAFRSAADRVDLVVSTGGLGPTPDDLTREAISAALGETPTVDPDLERWLRDLWARRNQPFPEMNLKQAWLIPSATPLPNPNGTAPGWWVDRPDGGVIVAMPGPPREMREIWAVDVLSRLRDRGAGQDVASRTLRLAGIGESQVADLLGEPLLRAADPIVATYARADAVDVRISARGTGPDGGSAAQRVATTTDQVARLLAGHIWAEGDTSWADAIDSALRGKGPLAIVEIATGGALAALIGGRDWNPFTESLGPDTATARSHGTAAGLEHLARRAMELAGAPFGVAVRARARGADTAVSVVVVTPRGVHRERRLVFLRGPMGRSRTALAAAHVLLDAIRNDQDAGRAQSRAAPRRPVSDGRRAEADPGRGRRSDRAPDGGARRP